MKRLALVFSLISAFSFAQTDVEDQAPESMVSLQTAQNVMTYDLRGIYQIADKTCSVDQGHTFNSVKYSEGEQQLNTDLKKRINQYLNSDAYAADGHFYIDLTISKSGDIKQINVGPDVPNTRYFYDDLKSAVKKIKGKWIPASCDATPIESKVRVKLLFDSLVIDNNAN